MPCYFHVKLDSGARALAERLTLEPYSLLEKGKPIPRDGAGSYEHDRLSFVVSEAEFEQLPEQFVDAIEFLQTHKDDVRLLAEAGEAYLDFGHSPRGTFGEPYIQVDRLPQELVRLAATLNVALELSLYLLPLDDEEAEQGAA